MARLLFEKSGNAIWISHLDLMRLFQRAFQRAGLPLTHTNGFNQRPSVSIALPMSVGISSCCELLDFDLDRWEVAIDQIPALLNPVLIPGVKVLCAYQNGRKLKEITFLQYNITLHYDHELPTGGNEKIQQLFSRESLSLEKRNRNGITQQDIIPMIRKLEISEVNKHTLQIQTVLCCQNPSLNPAQLLNAIEKELPELLPDWTEYSRMEVLDKEETFFR